MPLREASDMARVQTIWKFLPLRRWVYVEASFVRPFRPSFHLADLVCQGFHEVEFLGDAKLEEGFWLAPEVDYYWCTATRLLKQV
jgi:hypothetical protein